MRKAPQSPAPGEGGSALAAMYRFLHPSSGPFPSDDVLTRMGPAAENAVSALIITNVIAFVWSTTPAGGTQAVALEIFEAASVAVFTLEWAVRVWTAPEERAYMGRWGRLRYAVSMASLLDLAAILPTLTDPLLPGDSPSLTFLRSLKLLRLVRGRGAFARSLSRYTAIIRSCLLVFQLTLAIAMVTWVISSVLFYYAERHNPDPDIRRHYRSVPEAMWITLLNLSGESPLCR